MEHETFKISPLLVEPHNDHFHVYLESYHCHHQRIGTLKIRPETTSVEGDIWFVTSPDVISTKFTFLEHRFYKSIEEFEEYYSTYLLKEFDLTYSTILKK